MFVGDDINDSVSIKQADIGVALNSLRLKFSKL